MNSNTLTIIGLVLSGIALIAGVYAVLTANKTKGWQKIFGDKNEHPENLEEIISSIAVKIKTLENGHAMANGQIAQIEELLSRTVQSTGLVRFNSLADEGGNLSFALALLDARHSGIVLTSLNGRQQNRIYAKQITGGNSEVPLSEEERDAVFAAIGSSQPPKTQPTRQKHKRK